MNTIEKQQMGIRIKAAREVKELTQDALAEKLNMKNRASIANYEAGRSIPPSDILKNLADILEKTTDFLLGRGKSVEIDFGADDIGWAIREERQSLGMTQKELGELIGEHQKQISNYEQGLKPIYSPTIDKIMKEFETSFPSFLVKYNMWDGYTHPEFEGNADKQIAFEKANYEDAMSDPGLYSPNILNIPLIGTICAGDGLLAESNIEEYISYPFQSKRQPDYALRVKGDSMIDAGIEDGAVVYIREAQWAEHNGQIVAAVVNEGEDGMLKRMRWTEGSPVVRLVPENDSYETLELLPNQIQVCGVYMGHFSPERG